MTTSEEPTRIGFTNPNSTMDAAICATCSGECVLAFLAKGTSRSVGQISMCIAIAGVKPDSRTDAVHDLNSPPDPSHDRNSHRAANPAVSWTVLGELAAIW